MSPDQPDTPGPSERDGDMGVSSERVGPTGPGQVGTTGERDVSEVDRGADADVAAEQAADGEQEVRPDSPVPPVAGYNSHDDRSAEHPFHTDGPRSEAGS